MLKIGVMQGDDIGLEVVPETVKVMKAAAQAAALEIEWLELPLWLSSAEYAGMLSVDPSPAFGAGLETRPLEETVRDTLAWVARGEAPAGTDAGLDRAKEQRVLDAWLSKE